MKPQQILYYLRVRLARPECSILQLAACCPAFTEKKLWKVSRKDCYVSVSLSCILKDISSSLEAIRTYYCVVGRFLFSQFHS